MASIRRHDRQGSVSYEVVVDLGMDPVTGKRRQRSKSFKTKREATGQLNVWQVEIDKGIAVDTSRQTIRELLLFWLDAFVRPNVKATTLESYSRIVHNHLIPHLGSIEVQKLTPTMLQKYYSDRLAAGTSLAVIHLAHVRISQALEQAVKLGLASRNVAKSVTPPRYRPAEMKAWTAEEARRFLAVAKTKSRVGPLWLLLLSTGLRKGEALGLRWEDVDLDNNSLQVRRTLGVVGNRPYIGPPKSKAAYRTVELPHEAVAALCSHRAKQHQRRLKLGTDWQDLGLVFSGTHGQALRPNNIREGFSRLIKLAEVPQVRIHDLRHTFVTQALAAGAPVQAVSKHVGHSNTSMTMNTYAHVLQEQHRDVARKIGGVLFGEEQLQQVP